MKKTILLVLTASLLLAAACNPRPVNDQPQPSISIDAPTPSPEAVLPDSQVPPEGELPGETDQPDELAEVTVTETDLDKLLDLSAESAEYDEIAKVTYFHLTVRNVTKSSLKGGILMDVYMDDKMVATVACEVDAEDAEDNLIKSGETATLFAEVAGKNCRDYDSIELKPDPAKPYKAVS